MAPAPPTHDDLVHILRAVHDPELGVDIVTLGMVRDLTFSDGVAAVTLVLTTAGCPLRAELKREIKARLGDVVGVDEVKVTFGEMTPAERAAAMASARKAAAERAQPTAIPDKAQVILVASGKGGVGKSSVTANLAVALARLGYQVGLIDADIWGFSIPRMLGVDGRLGASESKKIEPHAIDVTPYEGSEAGSIQLVSMGLLVEDEGTALMWRGLILNRAVQHFLEDVDWGELDYVLVDMPPGTGDVSMGLARMIPRATVLVVTTPATGAQKVASRAVAMSRANYLRVLGAVENMSEFVAPDGSRHPIFGSGGGQRLADDAGIELLATIPIHPTISAGGDSGRPVAMTDEPGGAAFRLLAETISTDVLPPAGMDSCTARIFGALKAAAAAIPATPPVSTESATAAEAVATQPSEQVASDNSAVAVGNPA